LKALLYDAALSAQGPGKVGTRQQGNLEQVNITIFVKGDFKNIILETVESSINAVPGVIKAFIKPGSLKGCITFEGRISASEFTSKVLELVTITMEETGATEVDVQLRHGLCLHFMKGAHYHHGCSEGLECLQASQ
jgi:hypothetical protein